MSSSLLQIGLGSLLSSPAVAEFAAKAGEKAFSVLQAYFTFSADEISKGYQKSFENALGAIRDELDQKRSLVSSKLRRDFSAQFAEPIKIAGKGVHSDALKIFVKHKDKLFQIEKITESDLAALINFQSTVALTDFLLDQMQLIASVDEQLATFLRHDDLLGKAMLFFLREQFRTDPRFEKTLAALQREAILFNQQLMLDFMKNLRLSSQVKASDEFTRHDTETRRFIQKSVARLKGLPTQLPEYSRLALLVGSATSSTGDLQPADDLFSQVIENTQSDDEKALAYFNRFQVRLRCKAYDNALADLDAAIAINPEQYALHDVKTYPMVQLLGAGGMGCVFLCRNRNPLINKEQVVVKCFWETLKGSPNKVFKEAVAMREIAGDYVPEPLHAGYANPFKQERAFFVTEYIEGTIDGEGWLEKYGTMDLKTGWQVALSLAQALQVAHDKDIFHLDLKPANILLTDSPAAVPLKIIDFGLAQIGLLKQQEALTRQNKTGLSQFGQAVMGTLLSERHDINNLNILDDPYKLLR
ncbi:secreted protein containing Serine/threonine protein kinase-related domain protein [Candidatus Thiomargarita nelsonii]|uniref:Secreted protein containing Serine/threonine protein kinase-related domain protein n=1 Tax=Candidatus Thiomargarita nelsonii TaxID=1003181 RepID=A0A176RUI7_9GAMM|nr:secreted protein containing Serine/threonine protein kinase-related domain protein [Candidatus Thiomargarita nelsonii]